MNLALFNLQRLSLLTLNSITGGCKCRAVAVKGYKCFFDKIRNRARREPGWSFMEIEDQLERLSLAVEYAELKEEERKQNEAVNYRRYFEAQGLISELDGGVEDPPLDFRLRAEKRKRALERENEYWLEAKKDAKVAR